jgi:hypothetical protein
LLFSRKLQQEVEEIKAGAIDAELKMAMSEKLASSDKDELSALNSPASPQFKRVKLESDGASLQFSPPAFSSELGSFESQTTPLGSLSSSQQISLKEDASSSNLSLTDSQSRLLLTSSTDGTKLTPEEEE